MKRDEREGKKDRNKKDIISKGKQTGIPIGLTGVKDERQGSYVPQKL